MEMFWISAVAVMESRPSLSNTMGKWPTTVESNAQKNQWINSASNIPQRNFLCAILIATGWTLIKNLIASS